MDTLVTLEEIWDEYQIYSNDELNPVRDQMSIRFPDKE